MPLAKSSLTPSMQRFVELLQTINHGRIRELRIHDGKPVLDPPPKILRTCKFGGENGPNVALAIEDFILKEEVADMIQIFERERSFVVEELVVVGGLPLRMTVRDTVSI